MRKGSTVIDQDVFSLADGSRLESVTDLLTNESNDAIVALLVDSGGLMGSSRVIPISAVHRFGPSAVMVDDADVIVAADDIPEVKGILERGDSLLGSRVLTIEGEDLGEIKDMYFDESDGHIRGFEVSGGRVGDLMEGTSYLKLEQISTVGVDAVIAHVVAKEAIAGQRGGVAGALDSARDKADEATEALKEGTEGARDKLGHAADKTRETAKEAGDPDGTLVGRRTRADVSDDSGSIIIANGQRIELEDVEQAREADRIDELYQAAQVERQRSGTDQAADAMKDVSSSASDIWDRFTKKLSDLTDATGQKVDGEMTKRRLGQINDAIGRPVTKVFLDRDDEVILDLGDLVTHQAVQRTHENGMLDSLLDSVYTAEVSFTRDELRAKIKGDSVVEDASGGAQVVEDLEHHKEETERGQAKSDEGDLKDDGEDSGGEAKQQSPGDDEAVDDPSGPGEQGARMTSDAPATNGGVTPGSSIAGGSARTSEAGSR